MSRVPAQPGATAPPPARRLEMPPRLAPTRAGPRSTSHICSGESDRGSSGPEAAASTPRYDPAMNASPFPLEPAPRGARGADPRRRRLRPRPRRAASASSRRSTSTASRRCGRRSASPSRRRAGRSAASSSASRPRSRRATTPPGPGYLAYIPGGGVYASALADFIATATNRYVGVTAAAPALAQIEETAVAWLCTLMGLPAGSRGILTSGGSLSNFSAIVTARRRAARRGLPGRVDLLLRGDAPLRGEGRAPRRLPASEPARRCRRTRGSGSCPAALEAAIREDRARGRRPFLVVANVGTTNTGAVDPLPEILGDRPRARPLGPRRRRLRRLLPPGPRRRGAPARDRGLRLDHPRPAQGPLPALRPRRAPRARRRGARPRPPRHAPATSRT